MAFRLTGATTPNWSISTTAGDSVPGSAYQLVSNPLVRDDLLLSGAGRVEVTNLGRWAWAHSRKGTKAGGQLFREGLLRHLESWRKSWLMTVFLAGEKCFDSTKEKFHRERKARIFRGWLCGFRTYFQYIYIYIHISSCNICDFWKSLSGFWDAKALTRDAGCVAHRNLSPLASKFYIDKLCWTCGTLENASEERGKLQETEVELYRARESLSSVGVTAVTVVYQASYSTTITCPFCITWLRPEKKSMMWSIWKRWFLAFG